MKISVNEIARICNGELTGDGFRIIETVKPLEQADSSSLSYAASGEMLEKINPVKLGCLIAAVSQKEKFKFDFPVVWVENPKAAFAAVLKKIDSQRLKDFKPGISPKADIADSADISKTAHIAAFCFVDENAVVEDGAIILSGVYIGKNCRIGKNTLIYQNVSIRENVIVGDGSIIHSNAVIGSDGYGYTQVNKEHFKIPQIGIVRIGNNVEIGAGVCIDRATLGETYIGSGTKIDNLVHIAHNVSIGRNCLILAQAGIAGSSKIGDNVIIAGQAGVSDHVEIEDDCVIMGKSGVMGKVKKGSVLFGYLARPRGEYMRIEAIMSRLPEIYSFYKKAKKILNIDEKNDK